MKPRSTVVYWDTSAILSVLFADEHTAIAARRARKPGFHVLSSLAWAESHAVIARLERDHALPTAMLDSARDILEMGPWRRVNVTPEWNLIESLSRQWPLRGADLWHLAAAKNLQNELPELNLLSFDSRLAAAAKGEGLA